MCIQAYYGWGCGHKDLAATELPIEPCGPPDRYSHEPFCSPPIYELLCRKLPGDGEEGEDDARTRWVNSQIHMCTACWEIIYRMKQQWKAKEAELLDQGDATEKDLGSINARLAEFADTVMEKGRSSGPDHTLHLDELELGLQAIFQDAEKKLKQLKDAKEAFQNVFNSIDK